MSQQHNKSLLSQSDNDIVKASQTLTDTEPLTEHDAEDNAFQLTPLQKLIDKVGGEGKYQFYSFLVMAFTWFLTAWLLLGIAFFFDDTITCNEYDTQKKCMDLVCNSDSSKWKQIITTHANSIVFEFEPYMLCDTTSTVLQSMVFIGSLVGFFIIPFIADNLGRKIAMQISWVICTLGVFLLVIAGSTTMIAIGYLLAGLGSNPAITLCFSFINEQCLYKSRQRYGVFVQIFLALGESTIALMFIPQGGWGWRWVMLVLLVMVVIMNGFLFYLLETPKFLFNKSKEKTLEVLNIIAARNKKQPLKMEELEKINISNDQDQNKASLIDLFKYKSLRMITIATGFGFLGIQTIYYFTSLNLGNAGFNMLVNQEIIGGSEIAGYIVAEIIISKIKRRPFSLLGMGISSAVCLVLAILTSLGNSTGLLILETIALIINRLVVCCFWSIFFVYVAQLYPTKVRSLGYGWVSAIGMIGSALAPYLIQISVSIGINTWIDPAIIGLVGTVFIFFLPETYGQKLEDEIQEERHMVKQSQTTADLPQN